MYAAQALYCARIKDDSAQEMGCEEEEAQDRCRRTCGLCYDKLDSSSLLWYNQARRPLSNEALSSYVNDPLLPDNNLSTTGLVTVPDLKEDVAQSHNHSASDDPGASSGKVDSIVESMLSQQAKEGKREAAEQAAGDLNLTKKADVDAAAGQPVVSGRDMPDQANASRTYSTPGHEASKDSTGSSRAQMDHLGDHQGWKHQLNNPFYVFLLCLCALSLTCNVWLSRSKIRRKKVQQ